MSKAMKQASRKEIRSKKVVSPNLVSRQNTEPDGFEEKTPGADPIIASLFASDDATIEVEDLGCCHGGCEDGRNPEDVAHELLGS